MNLLGKSLLLVVVSFIDDNNGAPLSSPADATGLGKMDASILDRWTLVHHGRWEAEAACLTSVSLGMGQVPWGRINEYHTTLCDVSCWDSHAADQNLITRRRSSTWPFPRDRQLTL